MSARPALGGGLYVADTSAWMRRAEPRARRAWRAAVLNDQILITPVVAMELLYTARNDSEFSMWERDLAMLREAPLDRAMAEAAVGAMRDLARKGGLAHRVPVSDALIAAAAAQRGVGVLHHDGHFDRLATVLGFDSRWLPPRPA